MSVITAITFLGTSSGAPSKTRNVTSHVIHFSSGRQWMVDCGEGTQHQILQSATVKTSRLDVILITHVHGDHMFGLPGLICSRSLAGHTNPLTLIGPVGVAQFLNTALKISRSQGEDLGYDLKIIELSPDRHYDLGVINEIHLSAHPIKHSIPCHGFVLTEPDKRGKVDKDKLKKFGLAGPNIRMLTQGHSVILDNNKQINPEDVMGPNQKGRVFVLLGDTYDPTSISEAAMDCDTLVHECTYDTSMTEKALANGHSTSRMAGLFANKIRAKRLVLTHFSPRYDQSPDCTGKANAKESPAKDTEPIKPDTICIDQLVAEASAQCVETHVIAAYDHLTIPI